LVATHAGEAGVAEIFRALTNRLRDSTWTIVFKSLIIVHLMIREGEPEVTLKYLAQNPHRKLAINSFTEGTFANKVPDLDEREVMLRLPVEVRREAGETSSLSGDVWRGRIQLVRIADIVCCSADTGPQHTDILRVPPSTCDRIWRDQGGLRAWWRRAAQAIEHRQGPSSRGRERTRADKIPTQVPSKVH
jgi:hypothetical protein